MNDRLPADVDRRLAAIAAGRGGTSPSAAHPDCTCIAAARAYADRHGWTDEPNVAVGALAEPEKCPVHRTRGRS